MFKVYCGINSSNSCFLSCTGRNITGWIISEWCAGAILYTHIQSICLYTSLCEINCTCFQICVLAHSVFKIAEGELGNNENFHCDLKENQDIPFCIFCCWEKFLLSGKELNWELRILTSTSTTVFWTLPLYLCRWQWKQMWISSSTPAAHNSKYCVKTIFTLCFSDLHYRLICNSLALVTGMIYLYL